MSTKLHKRNLSRYRVYFAARITACVTFVVLLMIAVSSIVLAMSLDQVPAENGIPASWNASSIKTPDTITVPITYWDQRVDACDAADRQFEWGKCHYWTKGALQGIVQNTLGHDGLPVPTYSDSDSAWQANHDIFTANVTGHNPVLPSDNFYRWFHNVDGLSKQIKGHTVTFNRTSNSSTYVYGGQHIYPLDNISGFDEGDIKLRGADGKMHNFHFTGHLRIPIRISASGQERFVFSGDDDVWVFLNNQLVLDIGGLHEPLGGWFIINTDGTVDTHVNSVSNVTDRTEELTECMKIVRTTNNQCNTNFNNFLVAHNQPANNALRIGLSAGDVVYLDFFYAERSSDGSNTKITIENMEWPISADPSLSSKIVKELDNTNIVEFQTSLTNRDPDHTLQIHKIASHINDTSSDNDNTNGFIPLNSNTLYYTTTPENDDSWSTINLSAPADSSEGFTLDTPLTLAPYQTSGDTAYFRYYAETLNTSGTLENTISYYSNINNTTSIAHDSTQLAYQRTTIPPEQPDTPDPENPNPITPGPEKPDPEVPDHPSPVQPNQPSHPETPTTPDTPTSMPEQIQTPSDPLLPAPTLDDNTLIYLAPLGEVAYIPNTGVINSISPSFTTEFATVILSQSFVMTTLLIFAVSFALYVSFRKYRDKAIPTRANHKNSLESPTAKPAKASTKTKPSTKAKKRTKSTTHTTTISAKAKPSSATKQSKKSAKSARKSSVKKSKKS